MLARAVNVSIQKPSQWFSYLHDPVVLGLRIYVGWQFFKAGLLKLENWDSTIFLFQYEYRVPLLGPETAAVLGTVGELVFPVLLWTGFASRLSAIGLQFVNIIAVVSYAHVIFNPEFGTGALKDHLYWGLMLLVIMVYGPGRASLDYLMTRVAKAPDLIDGSPATIKS